MNSSITTIVGGLIEVLARSRHAQMLGRNRESRPGISYQNQSLAAYIMCTNGQLDITDGVFAPYSPSNLLRSADKPLKKLRRPMSEYGTVRAQPSTPERILLQ